MAYKPFKYGQFDIFTAPSGQYTGPRYTERTGVPTTVYYDIDSAVNGGPTNCERMWIIGLCPW